MKNVTPDGPPRYVGRPLGGQKGATEGDGGEINKEPCSQQKEGVGAAKKELILFVLKGKMRGNNRT